MPLRMFKLKPGQKTHYRVSVPGRVTGSPLFLTADRPQEGLSLELALSLSSSTKGVIANGRVPLARGYLAVIQEVERQLLQVIDEGRDGEVWFELQHQGELERHV